MASTKFLTFNSTGNVTTSSGEWNNTAPTNTVFTIGNQGRVNTGSGNGILLIVSTMLTDFVKLDSIVAIVHKWYICYTGFRRFVLFKEYMDGSDWSIYDNKRSLQCYR